VFQINVHIISVISFQLWQCHSGRRWRIFLPLPQQGDDNAVFSWRPLLAYRMLMENGNIEKGREKDGGNGVR